MDSLLQQCQRGLLYFHFILARRARHDIVMFSMLLGPQANTVPSTCDYYDHRRPQRSKKN